MSSKAGKDFVAFDGDDDDEPRTKAKGVLSKPTTKARLKFRVASVE
jgi:hypothetical protein